MRGDHLLDTRRIRGDVCKQTVTLIFVDLARVRVEAADEQIEIAVAIHVGERGPAVTIVVHAAGASVRDTGSSGVVLKQQAVALLGEAVRVVPYEQVDVAVVVAVAGRGAADRHHRELPGEHASLVSPDKGRARVADLVGDVRGFRRVDEGRRSRRRCWGGGGASAFAARGKERARGACQFSNCRRDHHFPVIILCMKFDDTPTRRAEKYVQPAAARPAMVATAAAPS